MRKTYLDYAFLIIFLILTINVWSQTLVFTNTGKMAVAYGSSMYIGGTTQQRDSALTVLDGSVMLTGHFINNVNRNRVFTEASSGLWKFGGDKLQNINGSARRDTNYIAFPNVEINKIDQYVVMDPYMGADIKTLDLQKGKLQLNADGAADGLEITSYNSHVPSRMAYLRVHQVVYNRDPAFTAAEKGIVEVVRALPGNHDNIMFGFASPYKSMYSDYFYANYISAPQGNELWTKVHGFSDTASILNPDTLVYTGHGYVAGQNILPPARYTLSHPALYDDRFTTEIVFNRYRMDAENNPINTVITNADKYTVEELNTGDVVVNLKKGWQYIGNPFTAPLDLGLLLNNAAANSDAWTINRSETSGVYPRYFVMAGGHGAIDNWMPDRFHINSVWLVGQAVGSTVSREADNKFVIAPMQMIAVYANNDVSITIPASQKTHDFSKKTVSPTNEFLLEVTGSMGFDRTVLVFDPASNANASDKYDAIKTIDSLASPGQIFTQSADGYAMISNVLPMASASSVELGLTPALSTQSLTISAYRKSSVSQAWLEDRIGNVWTDLRNVNYTFNSGPNDRIDRFVLHINVPQGSATASKPIPENLFVYSGKSIPATSKTASKSTGPVGSVETDIEIALHSDTVCSDGADDAKINVDPSTIGVDYKAYDQSKGGSLKGEQSGTGNTISINVSPNSDKYYVEAPSTDGLVTIIRRRPVAVNYIKSLIYPDIRVLMCPQTQTINLTKYLDSLNFHSVTWEKISGTSTLAGNQLFVTNTDIGTQTLKYTVTDVCKENGPARLYISTPKHKVSVSDTIVLCYEVADIIQLNQIFGKEGGKIVSVHSLSSDYFYESSTSPFTGAAYFRGKAAYLNNQLPLANITKYGPDARVVVFKFIPDAGSCYEEPAYTLVLILNAISW